MNNTYVQGFIDKCAALGVDPETLVKMSAKWQTPTQAKGKVEQRKPGDVASWSGFGPQPKSSPPPASTPPSATPAPAVQ